MTGWTITKDCGNWGIKGIGLKTMPKKDVLNHPEKRKFRLLDDDGEIYCYGWIVSDDSENLFSPLDDFGYVSLGCTEIQIRENGEWKTV